MKVKVKLKLVTITRIQDGYIWYSHKNHNYCYDCIENVLYSISARFENVKLIIQ